MVAILRVCVIAILVILAVALFDVVVLFTIATIRFAIQKKVEKEGGQHEPRALAGTIQE